jgi:hypothetical protein
LCPHFLLFISSRCELVGFDFPLLARRARRPVEFSQILCPCSVAVASAGRPGLDFIRFWLHWLSHVRWLLSPDLVGVPSAAHRRVICFSRERGAGQHHRRFRSSFGWFRPRASFGAVRARSVGGLHFSVPVLTRSRARVLVRGSCTTVFSCRRLLFVQERACLFHCPTNSPILISCTDLRVGIGPMFPSEAAARYFLYFSCFDLCAGP